jgi:hypothetical protein
MQVKDRSSSVIAIRAAVLRDPGHPLRIEKLEMEGPREPTSVSNAWMVATRLKAAASAGAS